MSTVGRGTENGIRVGTPCGGGVGAFVGLVWGFDGGLINAFLAMVLGAINGSLAGLTVGVLLGVVAGWSLRLVLGPEREVPRRAELAPVTRFVGAIAGFTPLLLWPLAGQGWPVLLAISAITAFAIAARAPRIAGIPGFEPKQARSTYSRRHA